MGRTIPALLDDAARRRGDRPWLCTDSVELSFRAAVARIATIGRRLRDAGIAPGDLVVLTARNEPDYLLALLAVTTLGAVAVPTNPRGTQAELHGLLAQLASGCRLRAIVTDAELADLVHPAAPHRPDALPGHRPQQQLRGPRAGGPSAFIRTGLTATGDTLMCHAHDTGVTVPKHREEEVRIPLPSGERLPALYCAPPGDTTGPAVLIVSDIYGRIPFYRNLAALLTAEGLSALLPDYFFRQGPLDELTREHAFARHTRLDEPAALHDLEQALSWLRGRPEVSAARLGLLGFCLGGTLAFDLAARRDDVVAVCYYAFPLGMDHPHPAPRPIDCAHQLASPTLAFWGADDDLIGRDQITALTAAAERAGVDYRHVVYPNAGHGFLRGLTEPTGSAAAAHDAWRQTRDFFADRLHS